MGPRCAAALLGFSALLLQLPARAGDEVTVRLVGARGAVLQRAIYDAGDFEPRDPSLWNPTWVDVCTAPCESRVPRGSYRIGGDGVRPSHLFALDADGGDHVLLQVEKAGQTAHTTGIVLVVLGSVSFVAGGVLTFIGLLQQAFSAMFCFSPPCASSGGDGALAGGAASMTLGAMLTIVGAVMVGENGSSTVEQTVEPPASSPPPSVSALPRLPDRVGFGVPLVSVTF